MHDIPQEKIFKNLSAVVIYKTKAFSQIRYSPSGLFEPPLTGPTTAASCLGLFEWSAILIVLHPFMISASSANIFRQECTSFDKSFSVDQK